MPKRSGTMIKEGRLGQLSAGGAEIGADGEAELIAARFEGVAGQHRRVGAAVSVGRRLRQPLAPPIRVQPVERHLYPGSGCALHGVEHMRGQPSHLCRSCLEDAPSRNEACLAEGGNPSLAQARRSLPDMPLSIIVPPRRAMSATEPQVIVRRSAVRVSPSVLAQAPSCCEPLLQFSRAGGRGR